MSYEEYENILKSVSNKKEKNTIKKVYITPYGWTDYSISRVKGLYIKVTKKRVVEIVKRLNETYGLNIQLDNINYYQNFAKVRIHNYLYIIFVFAVNSHVIIPHFILKEFINGQDNAYVVDYYNMKTQEFEISDIKKYNSNYGHFLLNTEEILNEYETTMCKLIKKFELASNSNGTVTEKDIQRVKDFFGITLLRNDDFIEMIEEQIPYSKMMAGLDKDFILQSFSTKGGLNNLFKQYDLYTVFYDGDDQKFIINDNLITEMIGKLECIVMPVKPNFAFILINGRGNIIQLSSNNIIHNINQQITAYAILNNKNLIGDKEIIKNMLDECFA